MNSFRILFYLIAYVITRTHANNATEKVRIILALLKGSFTNYIYKTR